MSFIINHSADVQNFRVTLTEKAILPGPVFHFRFKNEVTRKSFDVALEDISPCVARWNEFQISGLAFPSPGWYSYEARQVQPGGGALIVEIGRVQVVSPSVNFKEHNSNIEFTEHE